MTTGLEKVLQYITPFTQQELDEITPCFKPRSVKKGAVLLAEGSVCKEFYYVHSGCIRTCYLTREGDEKTRYVMPAYHIGTALTSFIAQKPSFEIVDALEDTGLMAIGHADFYRLVATMPRFQQFYQTILEMAYTFQNRKLESLVTLTAKQRYQQLLAEKPELVQKLSNKVLASYLDIRQETLSRIKSQ